MQYLAVFNGRYSMHALSLHPQLLSELCAIETSTPEHSLISIVSPYHVKALAYVLGNCGTFVVVKIKGQLHYEIPRST